MKTQIKTINNTNSSGVSFELTEKASLNGGLYAAKWWVSWDKIGESLFKDQYLNTDSVEESREARGE